uniref:UBX domain-containing protein 4 n=1 Tax=Oncorhynchus mykiss TaxID=8022 RepID=A0A8C7RLW3_ONCMY
MLWFGGSIPAAIISAKEQSSIFVVVITGDDEVSAQIMSSWEDDRVAEVSHNCCVAIKVDAKSETCSQFSQIYPVVCIPSSFFIGENGIPLEVVAGSVSAEELMKRIDKVKQVKNTDTSPTDTSPTDTSPTDTSPTDTSPTDTSPTDTSPTDTSPTDTSPTDTSPTDTSPTDTSPTDTSLEMERRKMGKEMLDFKRKNEDEKTKRIMDERSREKAEEKAARERVKAQIALDRADRAARYANNQEEVEAARLAALQARQAEAEAKKEIVHRERSAIARIQFRLPDGSFFTRQFSSEARLNEARQFAVNEVGNRYGNFSLATMFPRREFTADDLGKTLLELELAPGASIVLLPQTGRPNNTVVQSGGGIWAVLGTILYPLLAVWRFLSGFLFTSPATPGAAGPRGPAQQPNTTSGSGSSSSSAEPKRETLRKRTLEKQPVDFKRDGKIHRLRNHQDSEDENNTWNGNSTQQM